MNLGMNKILHRTTRMLECIIPGILAHFLQIYQGEKREGCNCNMETTVGTYRNYIYRFLPYGNGQQSLNWLK